MSKKPACSAEVALKALADRFDEVVRERYNDTGATAQNLARMAGCDVAAMRKVLARLEKNGQVYSRTIKGKEPRSGRRGALTRRFKFYYRRWNAR